MGRNLSAVLGILILLWSASASAWFIIIPTGAIKRAFETDPDSIAVSASDRALGKCAGLHVNQGLKYAAYDGQVPDATGGTRLQTVQQPPEYTFHEKMANLAIDKASDKAKVKDLADAYSTRWGRVAGADLNANRAYGADLARGCVQNNIPLRHADYVAWQARQEEQKRAKDDEQRRQAEAVQAKTRADEEERQAKLMKAASPASSEKTAAVDFVAEARKSARILGCNTDDVRVIGADGSNVLFAAACPNGQAVQLSCDKTGLCLKK